MTRPSQGLQFSKAYVGYEQHKAAEGLNPNALSNYYCHRKLFIEFAVVDLSPWLPALFPGLVLGADMENFDRQATTVGVIFDVELVCIIVFGVIMSWL